MITSLAYEEDEITEVLLESACLKIIQHYRKYFCVCSKLYSVFGKKNWRLLRKRKERGKGPSTFCFIFVFPFTLKLHICNIVSITLRSPPASLYVQEGHTWLLSAIERQLSFIASVLEITACYFTLWTQMLMWWETILLFFPGDFINR